MKAHQVSVSVSENNGDLYVQITMKLRGHILEREAACVDPINADRTKYGSRVKESSRKSKAKELRQVIEGIEFPER